MKQSLILWLALWSAPLVWLHAAEIHVAPTGQDSNPGAADKQVAAAVKRYVNF